MDYKKELQVRVRVESMQVIKTVLQSNIFRKKYLTTIEYFAMSQIQQN
jgi:hypothetical protein